MAWERWEGTIEYTFMAPLSRLVHLGGMALFAVLYGVLRTALLFAVVALFFGLHFRQADFGAALLLLAVASVSFAGLGMVTAVLPLISPEKGASLGFIAQGLLLVVSGVYYPVSVMPHWMQWISKISPATYALHGIRRPSWTARGSAPRGAISGRCWCSGRCRSRSVWPCSGPVSATPSGTESSSAQARHRHPRARPAGSPGTPAAPGLGPP